MQLAGACSDLQRLARAEQMALADDVIEPLRPHQLGERRRRLGSGNRSGSDDGRGIWRET